MSKKKKQTHKPKPTRKTNIKMVQNIQCIKDGKVVRKEECQACEYHDAGQCGYTMPKERIRVMPLGTPMRFNRNFFQMASDSLREESLNYYIYTDIMNEVRNISGYPNYTKLKSMLLRGDFKQAEEKETPNTVKGLKPSLILSEGKPVNDEDGWLLDGTQYHVESNDIDTDGDWTILFYLYRVYELNGFADIEVNGQPYRVMFSKSPHHAPDLIVAQQGKHIIIGR